MLSGILAALCKQIQISANYWPCNEIPSMNQSPEVLHQAGKISLSASAVEFAPDWVCLPFVCLQQEEGREALSYLPLSSVHHQQAHRADVFTNHIASVAASVNCCTVLAHTFVLFFVFFFTHHIFFPPPLSLATLNLWSLHPAEHKTKLLLLQLPLSPLSRPTAHYYWWQVIMFTFKDKPVVILQLYMLLSDSITLQLGFRELKHKT